MSESFNSQREALKKYWGLEEKLSLGGRMTAAYFAHLAEEKAAEAVRHANNCRISFIVSLAGVALAIAALIANQF